MSNTYNQTGSSFHSKAVSKQTAGSKSISGTHMSVEQAQMDKDFRDTATQLRDAKLATSVVDV